MLQFQAILCRNKKHTSDCFGKSCANLGLCSGPCPDVRRNTGKKQIFKITCLQNMEVDFVFLFQCFFPLFLFPEMASRFGWPVFSIDIVHIFDKILHMFPVRDVFTVITYCWEFDFCRKYFAIFGFSAIAVFFLLLLQQRNHE